MYGRKGFIMNNKKQNKTKNHFYHSYYSGIYKFWKLCTGNQTQKGNTYFITMP